MKFISKQLPDKGKAPANGKCEMVTNRSANAVTIGSITRNNEDFLNTSSNPVGTNLKILFDNVDDTLQKLNVVVEFTNMDAMWLTRVYKTYENEWWHRKLRINVFGKNKWFFYCKLCDNMFRQFDSIKSHLNQHMNIYPYVCKVCFKKYTNRKAATTHLRNIHKVQRDDWNDFLTS